MSDKPTERLAALDTITQTQRNRVRQLANLAADRLRPANLAQEAGNRAMDMGLDAVDKAQTMARAHPFKTAGIVVAAGATLAHKPLLRLLMRGYDQLRDRITPDRHHAIPPTEASED